MLRIGSTPSSLLLPGRFWPGVLGFLHMGQIDYGQKLFVFDGTVSKKKKTLKKQRHKI